MSKLSDRFPVGLSVCDRNGLSGNCGISCSAFQDFKCPNLTFEEHCTEKEKAGECRNSKCDLYCFMECKKYSYEEQLVAKLRKLKFSFKEISWLIDKND